MDDNVKDEAQEYIINEAHIRKFSLNISNRNNSSNSNNSTSNSNTHTTINQLNHFLAACGVQTDTSSSADVHSNRTIKEELAYYISKLKTKTTFEQFWINHETELPYLATLVRSFNIRPATSVPSESLFSMAAYVYRKQRSSLSPNALRYSMLLRDADIVASLI